MQAIRFGSIGKAGASGYAAAFFGFTAYFATKRLSNQTVKNRTFHRKAPPSRPSLEAPGWGHLGLTYRPLVVVSKRPPGGFVAAIANS